LYKDIFRKYPNKYESVISTLCENLESLEEPEAKAALIWIIGQYAERIDNSQVTGGEGEGVGRGWLRGEGERGEAGGGGKGESCEGIWESNKP
jgi:hypothetical protein